MTFHQWIKLHRVCERGQVYIDSLHDQASKASPAPDVASLPPMGSLEYNFWLFAWSQTYRGDWLCWMLDSMNCAFSNAPHAACRVLVVHEARPWWATFHAILKKHAPKGKYENIRTYFAQDEARQWSKEKAPLWLHKVWAESAQEIHNHYHELWLRCIVLGTHLKAQDAQQQADD